MPHKHTVPAHWFILRHLETLWNGTHPFLTTELEQNKRSYEEEIFPEIAEAIHDAMVKNIPDIATVAIISFMLVMLSEISIPEEDLPSVTEQLKKIRAQESIHTIENPSRDILNTLIERFSQ